MMNFSAVSHKKTVSIVFGLLLVAVSLFYGVNTMQVKAASGRDGRVITIHDNKNEKVVISKADTVAGVLKAAKIKTLPDDTIDPFPSTRLTASAYQINIYRARPVMVIDGNLRQTVMTPYDTPRQIIEKAGLPYYDEDNTQLARSENILASDGSGEELTITRATVFNLVLYGKSITARTQAKTVGEMLKDKKIRLGKDDTLSVLANTPLSSGLKVEIWRNGKQTINEEQEVVFSTQQIQDASQPVGYRQVKTPGVNGKKLVTYEVEMRNGQEISRKEIQSVQTVAPQGQVEVVGTKPDFSGDFAAALAKLRSCEGGYSSWNPAGYYGAYQFDKQTWSTVADPSIYGNATPAEQDAAAHQLYLRRGWKPWPNCGRNLPDTYR